MRPALLISSCSGPRFVSTWRAHWPTCMPSNASTVANRFGSGNVLRSFSIAASALSASGDDMSAGDKFLEHRFDRDHASHLSTRRFRSGHGGRPVLTGNG